MAVKVKRTLEPISVELKEAVLKKFVEAFSQGGDGVLTYRDRLCVPNVDDLRILSKYHSWQYQFTREPPRCIVIYERSIGEMG